MGVLLGLAYYFAYTIGSGNLANYINIRYAWLTHFAVAAFAVLAYASLPQGRTSRCCGGEGSWLKMAVLALPLVFGFGIVSRPLGADAFERITDEQRILLLRVGTDDMVTSENIPTPAALYSLENDFMPDKEFSTDEPSAYTILDWLRFYTKLERKDALMGNEADVIGFVSRNDTMPLGTFTVSRFFMRHCIFDTVPVGLYVQWKGAESLKKDTWVRVRGTFVVTDEASGQLPVIVAESVDIVPQPEIPYLYPEKAR
jgi:putative membrane protein